MRRALPRCRRRALRYALSAFNRGGVAAVAEAGFGQGLGGFVAPAYTRAAGLRQAIGESRFRLAVQPIVASGAAQCITTRR